MKIKRFVASDMRTALAAVKKEIGEDAVILSNKSIEDGVELVAAIDFDEEKFDANVIARQPKQQARPAESQKKHVQSFDITPEAEHQASGYEAHIENVVPADNREDGSIEEMRREMRALRRMMENELSGISWREMGDHRPDSKELFRQLMAIGLSADIAERLMRAVAGQGDFEQQWTKAMYYLAAEIGVTGDDLTERGGIVAVVGPTGVGKTTSIAKLAARYCLRHGNRHVAMISTDNYRIGAREQLHTYGRILNIPVRTASNAEELMETLNVFADKRFILIDTAGMSHQDAKLAEQLSMLEAAGRMVTRFLALSATTELAALHRALDSFASIRPDACLITKTDEAASLGSILSVVIKSGLPVAYYTDGQKVPEDMHVARANPLVDMASTLAQDVSDQFGDGYLAFALSDARTHAYM
ncbi:MAG: flagellar biosynthesis protein FlhF [Gammaproteobacteria bacterium]|nr:flagellar biosynthesis protein FlhF [Gammaproteobacteria bacterium]